MRRIDLVNHPRNYPEDLETSNLPFISVMYEGKEVFCSFYDNERKYDKEACRLAKIQLTKALKKGFY